VREETIGF